MMLGNRDKALAMPHKDLDAKLLLEQPDLLRHAWLRSVQGIRRLGHRQAVADDFNDVAELLEVHQSGFVIE